MRDQSRQPSASRPAARRRSGVWRRSCRGLAGRLRHGDTLKDLPDKDMGLYRCQPFGNRARVYPQSEHGPGVARCFGLNHDLPDHRQFSVPMRGGKTTSLFAQGRAKERVRSGFLCDCPDKQWARGCPSRVERHLPMRRFSSRPRVRTDYPAKPGPATPRSLIAQVETHPRTGRRRATAPCALPRLSCCGASHRPLDKRRFQRSPGLSSSPKT